MVYRAGYERLLEVSEAGRNNNPETVYYSCKEAHRRVLRSMKRRLGLAWAQYMLDFYTWRDGKEGGQHLLTWVKTVQQMEGRSDGAIPAAGLVRLRGIMRAGRRPVHALCSQEHSAAGCQRQGCLWLHLFRGHAAGEGRSA